MPLAPVPAPSGSSLTLVLRAVPSAGNTVDTTNATQAQAYTTTVASILGLLSEHASLDFGSAFVWELLHVLSESAVAMVLGLLSGPASASAQPLLCLSVSTLPRKSPSMLAAFDAAISVGLLCTKPGLMSGFVVHVRSYLLAATQCGPVPCES